MKTIGILLGSIILALFFAPQALACTNTINTNLTVSTPCSFSGTTVGVDNGNITVGTGGTLSVLNGQTIVRNAGKSITISGGGSIVLIGTARIVQSYIWCMDADSDGYCRNQTYTYGDNSPSAGYRRIANMTTLATDDCNDTSATGCNRIFIMAVTNRGNLGGLTGADAQCQTYANANLSTPGTFKAWLSSASVSASSRLTHATGDYIRVDGTVIANGWSDLTDGTLDNSIGGGSIIWSNSTTNGSIVDGTATGACSSWTSLSMTQSVSTGLGSSTTSTWTNSSTLACNSSGNVYCIEQ
jgi:hypothetical protein